MDFFLRNNAGRKAKQRMRISFAILMRCFFLVVVLALLSLAPMHARSNARPSQTASRECHIEDVDYRGWHAKQITNHWLELVLIPQNGGRLIQVIFAGHPYLFVNPKYAGKYLPPSTSQWFNYGGDKIWLLPEGNDDEQHWVGNSDELDDGPFSFRELSEGKQCEVELTGPADALTGVQFTRTVRIDGDSPGIHFRVSMKNITGHSLDWSMQSVSQYDTSSASPTGSSNHDSMNHDFWTFTPANRASAYLNRYHVRFGPAENPAVGVREDGLFTVHYVSMAAELWLDSTDGWLAVVDGSSKYAMVERFQYERTKTYPGKATVIFWTNGPELRLNRDGTVSINHDSEDATPHYLEAEINSPLCHLRAGESCGLETEWFPTRSGDEFHGATEAGILLHPLQAARLENGRIKLSGSFGVFFSGRLVAKFYDEHGGNIGSMPVANVDPADAVSIEQELTPPGKPARISLHLEDSNGIDRGALQEIRISGGDMR